MENLDESHIEEADSLRHSEESFEFTVNETLALKKNLDTKFEQETAAAPRPSVLPASIPIEMKESAKPSASKSLPVYLRLRPTYSKIKKEAYGTIDILSETLIQTKPPTNSNAGKLNRSISSYEFTKVFDDQVSQTLFYEQTALPLVQTVARQQSALLFCYGITNAGKTHTVLGDLKDPANWGLVPRAIQDLIHMKQSLQIAYFELYNEQIYDLLAQDTNCFKQESLKVRERNGEAVVQGLTRIPVQSVDHGIELTKAAKLRRHTATNNLNRDSSRSHCICQISVNEASLWIVDLAGSERVKRTDANGARRKEAAHINTSLMTLMQCLTAMREKSNVLPYRNSKLTVLFMKHFQGPSAQNTAMVVNANPAASDFDETQHVLGYAAASKSVQMKPMDRNVTKNAEYGYDGRRIEKQPTKLSNFVKALSPKFFKRKDPPQAQEEPAAKKPRAVQEETESQEETDPNIALQIAQLKMQLSVLRAENEQLKDKNEELSMKVDDIEAQLREEVANEMAEEMQSMQQRYEDMIAGMKPDATKSTRKIEETQQLRVKNEELQEALEEMRSKVNDCEDEMKLMREEHNSDIENLKRAHRYELQTKDVIIEDQKKQIHQLQAELSAANESETRDEISCLGESQSPASSQGSRRKTRTSKRSDASSYSKRSNKRSSRIPLDTISANAAETSPSNSEDSFGPSQWLFPKKEAKLDPSTGTYQRPRGRPPSGVEAWDEHRGAWRLSAINS